MGQGCRCGRGCRGAGRGRGLRVTFMLCRHQHRILHNLEGGSQLTLSQRSTSELDWAGVGSFEALKQFLLDPHFLFKYLKTKVSAPWIQAPPVEWGPLWGLGCHLPSSQGHPC